MRWCRRGDLNPHALAGTRSLVWRVCQFRHSDVARPRALRRVTLAHCSPAENLADPARAGRVRHRPTGRTVALNDGSGGRP